MRAVLEARSGPRTAAGTSLARVAPDRAVQAESVAVARSRANSYLVVAGEQHR
jgi:hypothetical protein